MALNEEKVKKVLSDHNYQLDKKTKDTLFNRSMLWKLSEETLQRMINRRLLIEVESLTEAIREHPKAGRDEIMKVLTLRIKQLEDAK